jgi:hypothetical protein
MVLFLIQVRIASVAANVRTVKAQAQFKIEENRWMVNARHPAGGGVR